MVDLTEASVPIFSSTYQAVQVAYLVAVASPPMCSMEKTFHRLYADIDDRKANLRKIDFGGLTAIEQRGECANIRGLVEKTLSGYDPEMDIILAKFCRDHNQVMAIWRVREYVAPLVRGVAVNAIQDMLMWIYYDRSRSPSQSAIARAYDISERTVRDTIYRMAGIVDPIEESALARLTEIFVREGIAKE